MSRFRNISMTIAALATAALFAGSVAPANAEQDDDSTTAVIAPTSFGQSATPITPGTALPNSDQLTTQDKEVQKFWTSERLASATPFEPLEAPESAPDDSNTAPPAGPEGSTPPTFPANWNFDKPGDSVREATPVTNFSLTQGKLFFGGYESQSYCSASALNTPTKRVIITAGHCLYYQGKWRENLVFVPRYDKAAADPTPVGIWNVRVMRTFSAWINNEDLRRDIGMATLANGGDRNSRIVDAVGGHGLTWGGSPWFDVSIFGYPSNKNNGRRLWAYWGGTHLSLDGRLQIGCGFGPGASGGPWLKDYNNQTGLGYVRSVTSTWIPQDGSNQAPNFDESVKVLMDATNQDW